tara:strand:- start:8013 stop:8246 length:234 start_codon:yes stop_codon:yes gene_type:complete
VKGATVIDVTCVDATEGLYAVFMDEEGLELLGQALVRAEDWLLPVSVLPKALASLLEELVDVQEWRETRLEEMALEA